jgi:iron(III) transport system permease protein
MTRALKRPLRKLWGKKVDLISTLLALICISCIFVPLFTMFAQMDGNVIQKVIGGPQFGNALLHSLIAAALSTLISVTLAYLLAAAIWRSSIRCKGFLSVIIVLPMLIPSISHGMGLVLLFGNNGLLTGLLGGGTIYWLSGIVIGSVLYSLPVAYLMFADIMKYEDNSPYEAAKVLGIPPLRRFLCITLPYLKKPLISIIFSTFTLVITDYGVPLMIGGKYTTIPVVMYQEVIGQLDFAKGAVYGTILLIPAVLAFVIDLCNKDQKRIGFVEKTVQPSKNRLVTCVSYLFCSVVAIAIILPVLAFVLLAFAEDYPSRLVFTFDNVLKTLQLRAGEYLLNSVLVALGVSVLGVVIAFITAYLSSRMKSKTGKFLHLSIITTAAIPGIVLGLSYVLTFRTSPIYGTLVILILVNMVHFIASPYLMIYNSLSKVNENLEGVGHTLGIDRFHMIKDVILPICRETLAEMFAYFFVNCMMTISAVSFLATTANKPVSLMINQFEAQSQLGAAAVVSLMILLVNLAMKGIVRVIRRRIGAK